MIGSRINTIFLKVPSLAGVIEQLNSNRIDWMIGGSGCLFLMGNERMPNDIDIFLRNEDHDRADNVFGTTSFQYTSALETTRNSNPEGDHAVQLTSNLQISAEGKTYDLSLTHEMLANRVALSSEKGTLWLMKPEDVLLIKAILQRGSEVGKHDVVDIRAFLGVYKIDKPYLDERIRYVDAGERVGSIFDVR